MTTSLIDSLTNAVSPELSARLASGLGEPEQNVARGLSRGMAATLMGILGKSGDSSSMNQIFSTITDNANDGRVLDDPAALASGATDSSVMSLGRQFLSNVFGSRAGAVNDVIAKASGLRIGSVSSLMQIAAPLVLGVLGRRVRDSNLNVDSFTRLLTDERDSIQAAAPAGIESALGTAQRVPRGDPEYEPLRPERTPEQARAYAREEQPSGRRWFWPAAAVLAALVLLWGVWPRHRRSEVTVRDTTLNVSGGEVAPPIAPMTPTPTTPMAPTGPSVTLPGGAALSLPATSPESRLIVFLNDSARRPDEKTWFVLDRMQFENNTAMLSPSSDAEIKDLAMVIKAYPNARVRIGGFTDNSGSESANRKLSKERADAARTALVSAGVDAKQVMAQGYGSQHPIADNSTEEGRAQNRRIGIIVVKK